jgi:hypothetical protein
MKRKENSFTSDSDEILDLARFDIREMPQNLATWGFQPKIDKEIHPISFNFFPL